jgi:hypothetical protein
MQHTTTQGDDMATVISTHFFKGSLNGKTITSAFPEARLGDAVDADATISSVGWYSDKYGRYAHVINSSGTPYFYRPNVNEVWTNQEP